jgi:hypothetical protein
MHLATNLPCLFFLLSNPILETITPLGRFFKELFPMRLEEVQQLLRARPFRPFRLHLSNGRSHEIRHPELVLAGRDTMFIGKPAADLPEDAYDNFAIVTLLHINDVEPLPVPTSPTTNGATS